MKKNIFIAIVLAIILKPFIAFSQNQKLIDSLQSALKITTSDSIRVNILNDLANSYFANDNNKSMQYAQEAFTISEKAGYKKGLGNAYSNIGWVHLNRDNYPEAFKNFRAAIKIKNELGDRRGTIRNYVALGHAYLGQGNYPEALKNYFEAIRINDATGESYGKDVLYENIALGYNQEGNYTEALKYYHQSLLAAQALGKTESIANIYLNIAGTHLNLKNYAKAQEYNLHSLKLFEETSDAQGKAYALSQIGDVYKAQILYSTALDYLFQSLKIADDNGYKLLQISVLNQIGTILFIQKKYAGAQIHLNKSLEIAKEIGSINEISNCYAKLSELDSSQGNIRRSLEEYKLQIIYRDSSMNLESVRKSEQVRMQFEMDKKEATFISEQEKKDALAKAEIKKQLIIRNSIAAGFAAVIIFSIVVYRQRNKISKERKRSDLLLLNILPQEVAEELKEKGSADAKHFDEVTVLFTDFKGFTQLSEKLTPKELIAEINECFSAFDHIMQKHGVEKIKTIGDAYMSAGGIPTPNKTHALDVVKAALEIRDFMSARAPLSLGEGLGVRSFEIRIGINTGPVVAGIVGVKKFAYDIWGDTVNTASRMESSGEVGKVNISETTYELVKEKFNCVHRGKIEAKHKGEIDMYFVENLI